MQELRILVIEDEAPIRQGIVDALRFHGYGTFEASDGDTGSEMAGSDDTGTARAVPAGTLAPVP